MDAKVRAMIKIINEDDDSLKFHPDESDFGVSRKGLKQLIEMFPTGEATIRELNSTDERLIYKESDSEQCSCLSTDENRSCNAEAEMQSFKEALANMGAERDAVLVEYRQSLEKQSKLENELSDLKNKYQDLLDSNSRLNAEKEALLNKENASLRDANEILETEVDLLSSNLHEKSRELQLWEEEVASYCFDLLMSSVREALFESKVHELVGLCSALEDSTVGRSIEIERMKDNISFLESENKALESQLAASVEQNAVLQTKLHSTETLKVQELTVGNMYERHSVQHGKIMLERLSCDGQELERLNLSVEELKRKINTNRKYNSTKAVEYTRLNAQLQDIDDNIGQLVDVNTKLMDTIKESPSSGDMGSTELAKAEQAERRKVSREARKEAEKIGRLQLDVQKMQYLFLKLEEEKKGKSRFLSDLLCRRGTRSRMRRKVHICGCDSVDASDPQFNKFVRCGTENSVFLP